MYRVLRWVFAQLLHLRQPTVAAVTGHASAAGAQLAASCDIVVASRDAMFSAPGSQRGRFCHTPAVALSRRMMPHKALEMLLLGSVLTAEEAEKAGLVNRVFSEDSFEYQLRGILDKLVSASGQALQEGKRGLRAQREQPVVEEQYRIAEQFMVECFLRPDAAEGTRAMMEKRPGVYTT